MDHHLRRIDVSELLDNSRLGRFHLSIAVLCGFCLMIDGFDVQSMGYVAPAIVREWNISTAALGPIFSAAFFGVLVGSLVFSSLADRIGRRPVLIGGTLFFAVVTLLISQVQSVTGLLIARFVAGLGFGSIMPNVVALISEFTPVKSRVALMMAVGNGMNIGAAFGGFIAAWLIPAFGWRSVFVFGGAVPLVIGILMIFLLPESLEFLVLQGKKPGKVVKYLKQLHIVAAVDETSQFTIREKKKDGAPFVYLFTDGRALVTILLWIVYFANLLNLFLLASWLPTVVNTLGYSTATSVLAGATLQSGGMIASFVMAAFVYRLGTIPVLLSGFAIGTVSIALIGQPGASSVFLFTVVFLAGWGVVGNQSTLNALAATYYPTSLRSTGVGWCLGVGRVGAIVGPLIAGVMISRMWTVQQLFFAAASLSFVGGIAMIMLRWAMQPAPVAATDTALVH